MRDVDQPILPRSEVDLSSRERIMHRVVRRFSKSVRVETAAALSRGAKRRQRVEGLPRQLSTIELTFFGGHTAGRSLGLRLGGEVWLFDCAEGTQHRMLHSPFSLPTVKRIFVSHLGDCFGLPGVVANMASAPFYAENPSRELRPPIQLVGPVGLRSYLRGTLGNSYVTLGGRYGLRLQILELGGAAADAYAARYALPQPLLNEVEGATIMPDVEGMWRIPDLPGGQLASVSAIDIGSGSGGEGDGDGSGSGSGGSGGSGGIGGIGDGSGSRGGSAALPAHRFGWFFEERPRPGRLRAAELMPLLRQYGINPGAREDRDHPTHSLLERFKSGDPISLPDGRTLRPEDFCDPPTSRKLAILPAGAPLPLAADAVLCSGVAAADAPAAARGVSPAGTPPQLAEAQLWVHGGGAGASSSLATAAAGGEQVELRNLTTMFLNINGTITAEPPPLTPPSSMA